MPKRISDPNKANVKIMITQAPSDPDNDIGEIAYNLDLVLLKNKALRDKYGKNRSAWILDMMRAELKKYQGDLA